MKFNNIGEMFLYRDMYVKAMEEKNSGVRRYSLGSTFAAHYSSISFSVRLALASLAYRASGGFLVAASHNVFFYKKEVCNHCPLFLVIYVTDADKGGYSREVCTLIAKLYY